MSITRRDFTMSGLALAAAPGGASRAFAQAWPAKPVKIVVPFVAGGAVDSFARVFAAKLGDLLGAAVVIDNRGGAGGNVGANLVAKSSPDGYTLLMNINGQAISPSIYKSLPFDPVADFTPVVELVTTSTVIVVNNNVPAKNFQEFVAYAKANPGKLNYGSTGVGNNLHLTMEMIKAATGMDIQMVPFPGDAPLFTQLIGGEIQCALVPTTTAKAHVDAGAIRAIAVTTAARVSTFPDVPTLMEQGMKDFSVTGWISLFAPKGTPKEIVDLVARQSAVAIHSAELKQPLHDLTLDPAGVGPDEFNRIFLNDVARFHKIIEDAHIPKQD
jgi:tripartite-type tricarboxylate transporter receptor subunit TctC